MDSKGRRAVLIVGFPKIKRNDTFDDLLIIQNSYAERFGFLGFAALPFDCQNIFTSFWAPSGPIIDEKMHVIHVASSSLKCVSSSVRKSIHAIHGSTMFESSA